MDILKCSWRTVGLMLAINVKLLWKMGQLLKCILMIIFIELYTNEWFIHLPLFQKETFSTHCWLSLALFCRKDSWADWLKTHKCSGKQMLWFKQYDGKINVESSVCVCMFNKDVPHLYMNHIQYVYIVLKINAFEKWTSV